MPRRHSKLVNSLAQVSQHQDINDQPLHEAIIARCTYLHLNINVDSETKTKADELSMTIKSKMLLCRTNQTLTAVSASSLILNYLVQYKCTCTVLSLGLCVEYKLGRDWLGGTGHYSLILKIIISIKPQGYLVTSNGELLIV